MARGPCWQALLRSMVAGPGASGSQVLRCCCSLLGGALLCRPLPELWGRSLPASLVYLSVLNNFLSGACAFCWALICVRVGRGLGLLL